MSERAFEHALAAHCETGVTAGLLRQRGLNITEPLVLGIGSGLFFLQLPFDSFFGAPTTSFRSRPGSIFKKTCQRLGVSTRIAHYRSPLAARDELHALVDRGVPVGLQTSVYFLDYMPRRFRFPFNAHNIVVHGRQDGRWLVSDPVLADPVECDDASLDKARFAAGLFAPRGRAYWVDQARPFEPGVVQGAIRRGVLETAYRMAYSPLPWFGWRAIAYLARRVASWPRRFVARPDQALVQLANVVRMQEEIGTGGAGFRYLFSAFLQEAAPLLADPRYQGFSERFTTIGDQWRQFAGASARVFRSKQVSTEVFAEVAQSLHRIALAEREAFVELNAWEKSRQALVPSHGTVEERHG